MHVGWTWEQGFREYDDESRLEMEADDERFGRICYACYETNGHTDDCQYIRQCPECGELDGMHIEGDCSRWRDIEPPAPRITLQRAQEMLAGAWAQGKKAFIKRDALTGYALHIR